MIASKEYFTIASFAIKSIMLLESWIKIFVKLVPSLFMPAALKTLISVAVPQIAAFTCFPVHKLFEAIRLCQIQHVAKVLDLDKC